MENSPWSTLLQSHSVWCWIATCCGRWLLRHERWGRAQCAFVDEKLMICANCEGKLMCLCKVVCFAGVDTCPRWQRSIFHMEINAKLFQKSFLLDHRRLKDRSIANWKWHLQLCHMLGNPMATCIRTAVESRTRLLFLLQKATARGCR